MTTRHKILFAGVGLVALSAVALAAAWTQRRPIAREIINDYLEDRGVKATYDLVEIGPKQQRLENIVIGDPANPDVQIKWAEVDVVTRLSGIEVKAVRASGIKAHASYRNGQLSLGAIDQLLPKSSGAERRLPDLDLSLQDIRATLDTEYGQIGARIDGKGNLANAFKGQIGLVAPQLQRLGCSISSATAFGTFEVKDKSPRFSGPVRLASANCDGATARKLDLTIDGEGDAALERFNGTVKLGGDALAFKGAETAKPRGTVTFNFDRSVNRWDVAATASADQTRLASASLKGITTRLDVFYRGNDGQWAGGGILNAKSAAFQGVNGQGLKSNFDFAGTRSKTRGKFGVDITRFDHRTAQAGATRLNGTYDLAIDADGMPQIEADGLIGVTGIIPAQRFTNQIRSLGAKARNTPAEALGETLVRDLARLDDGGDAKARYSFDLMRGHSRLALNDISAASRSGVRVALNGKDAVTLAGSGGLAVNGQLRLSGGGLPTSLVSLASTREGISGTAIIDPYAASGSRIALAPTRFSVGRGGTNFSTVATLDTRYRGIELRGLKAPLSSAGGQIALTGCREISFSTLKMQSLVLDPLKLNACLDGNQVKIAAPDIAGIFKGRRFSLTAKSADVPMGNGPFRIEGPRLDYMNTKVRADSLSGTHTNGSAKFSGMKAAVALGTNGNVPRLFADKISGNYVNGVAKGSFTNGRGALPNVPLDASRANGTWSYIGNILSADATSLVVKHAVAEPRFEPLTSNKFNFKLAGNSVTAKGDLLNPATGTKVAYVDIGHALNQGTGQAKITVDGLRFGDRLQPEMLTPLTNGIIQLVSGQVDGKGFVNWTPAGVTSFGDFKTDNMNFAAAFGPVTGLKGEISLSSLLGLEMAKPQTVKIGTVNPGILAENGELTYQLLPGQRIWIKGGEWPLAGGKLLLKSTTLDLGQPSAKELVFEVKDLDAATFVQQMGFENINATGKFSGTLPMVFDASGGKIVKGYLDAEGGTLSYIGPVSRENLGVYGSIAFDALKSMKFDKLHVDLGGPLDGEMVTMIKFNGINQAPITPGRAQLPLPIKVVGLTGIPFIFNITIQAPFRGLVTMGRSFQDAMPMIRQKLQEEEERKAREEQTKPKPKSKTRAE